MANRNYVGKQVTIPAGTRVRVQGRTIKRKSDATVTVRAQEQTKNGIRIQWKSHGYMAQATLA